MVEIPDNLVSLTASTTSSMLVELGPYVGLILGVLMTMVVIDMLVNAFFHRK